MAKFLVLELTDNDAKVLHVSWTKKTGMLLEDAFAIDFSDLEKDEESYKARGARLREKLKKYKIGTVNTGLIVPKQTSIVRVATLPSVDPAELEQMAQFKAEEYIPFNAERHIISHGTLRQDGVQGSDVLIAAVDGPVMEKAMTVCQEARLEPVVAEVSSIALVRAFSHHHEDALQQPSLLLLNIGKSYTDISILKDGILVATRSQPLGVERLQRDLGRTEEEVALNAEDLAAVRTQGWVDRVVRFTRQTYEFALREHNVAPSSELYICGEGSHLPELGDALARGLNVKLSYFHPEETLTPSGKGTVEEVAISGAATPLGTAMRMVEEFQHPRQREGRINLLPLSVIAEQQASERRTLLVISGTMVFITLVLAWFAYDRQSEYRTELAALYSDYNREMQRTVGDIAEKEERIRIIEEKKSDRASPLVLLDQITGFPKIGSTVNGGSLTLTEFRYHANNEVVIAGTAIELSDIGEFTEFLRTLQHNDRPVFADIGIPNSSPVDLPQRRGTVWSFSVTARLMTGTAGDTRS
jgi:type IV pilus assembly protein PilM